MNINQLKYLITVAEELNISKAAEKLYISQPSLSQCIKIFEDELGAKIFTRKPFRLTYAGEIFINWAKEVVNSYARTKMRITDIANESSIKFTVGISPYRSTSMLPSVIEILKNEYPNCNIVLEEYPTDILHQKLLEDKLDLMIDVPYRENSNYENIVVGKEKIFIAFPADWDIEGSSVDFCAFRDKPFIMLTEGQYLGRLVRLLCRKNGFSPNIFMSCHNIETVFAMIKRRTGASLLPETFIKNSDNLDGVRYCEIKDYHPERDIAIIYNKSHYLPKPVKRFIELFKASL